MRKGKNHNPALSIALTLGDPAGIGPEVIVRSLSRWRPRRPCRVVVIAPCEPLNALAKKLGLKIRFESVLAAEDATTVSGRVPCFFNRTSPLIFSRGRSQNNLTRLAMHSIRVAAALAIQKKVDAIVTAPIHKSGMKQAGFNIFGHTEFLAKLSKTKKFEMMLVGGNLRVALVTRHTAIKNLPALITKKRVEETILITAHELRRSFGIKKPKIVVCGLNPHAGETGTLGREEIETILPAVRSARKKTNAVLEGPLSPDALFYDAFKGRYDAEICMYHDQGLIPLKMISRGHGVNVTLGLPFVRTSPDHGTAYDIAESLTADPGSMLAAMRLATVLVYNRRKYDGAQHRS